MVDGWRCGGDEVEVVRGDRVGGGLGFKYILRACLRWRRPHTPIRRSCVLNRPHFAQSGWPTWSSATNSPSEVQRMPSIPKWCQTSQQQETRPHTTTPRAKPKVQRRLIVIISCVHVCAQSEQQTPNRFGVILSFGLDEGIHGLEQWCTADMAAEVDVGALTYERPDHLGVEVSRVAR